MRALSLILLALLLGSCEKFESWSQPQKSAASASQPASWNRTGVSEDQVASDLYSCRTQAEAVVERDRSIDQDIGSIDTEYGDAPALRAQMDEFGYQKRFEQTTRECMQNLGYGEPQAAGAANSTQPAPAAGIIGGTTEHTAPPPPQP